MHNKSSVEQRGKDNHLGYWRFVFVLALAKTIANANIPEIAAYAWIALEFGFSPRNSISVDSFGEIQNRFTMPKRFQ